MGDTFDSRKGVDFSSLAWAKDNYYDRLKQMGCEVHTIVGNHTAYYKNTNDVNSLTELLSQKFNNVHIYAEAQEVDFDGFPILLMPWINPQNEIYALGMMDDTRADTMLGHLEIDGFQMYAGHESQGGLSKVEFQRFDTVMSGHFHHKSDDGHVYYLGTPYEIYWNDWGDPKGFHTFDLETRELEFIPNQYTMFEKIYYDDSKMDYVNSDISKYDKKFVKIFVENRQDYFSFDKYLDRLYKEISVHDLKIVEDFSDLSADFVHDDIVEGAQDTMSLLDKYVDEIETSLDKNKIKSKLKSLYVEAGDLEI